MSRLIGADYDSGSTVYSYGYDVAGNLVNMDGTTRTFNAANQMTNDGTNTLTYDNNGNLTSDGVNDYTWDRANRLLEVDTGTGAELTAYAYDGMSNRISQAIGTSSPVVTQYLLDTQPGLAVVLQETIDSNVNRFIHGPRGIHAQQDNSGDWFWPMQDGLGSVRSVVDDVLAVQGIQHYEPYGTPYGEQRSLGMPFGFTGEPMDDDGLVYLRIRYINPTLGQFMSQDYLEALNRYVYTSGNPVNLVDRNGLQDALPFANCQWMRGLDGIPYFNCDPNPGNNNSDIGNLVSPGTQRDTTNLCQNYPQWCDNSSPQLPRQEWSWDIPSGVQAHAIAPPREGEKGVPDWLIELLIRLGGCLGDLIRILQLIDTISRVGPVARREDEDDVQVTLYHGTTYYQALRWQSDLAAAVASITSRQSGRDFDPGLYTSTNYWVAKRFGDITVYGPPSDYGTSQGGGAIMTFMLAQSVLNEMIVAFGVQHNRPITGGGLREVPPPHVETYFPYPSIPSLFAVSTLTITPYY